MLVESELVYTRGRAASRVTAALGIFIYVCIFMGHWIFGTGHMPVLLTQIAPSTSIWDLCVRAAQVYCPGVFYRRELLSCSNYDCRFSDTLEATIPDGSVYSKGLCVGAVSSQELQHHRNRSWSRCRSSCHNKVLLPGCWDPEFRGCESESPDPVLPPSS